MGYKAKKVIDINIVFSDIKETTFNNRNKNLKAIIKSIQKGRINTMYLNTLKQELEVLSDNDISKLNEEQLRLLFMLDQYYPAAFANMVATMSVGNQARFKRGLTDISDVRTKRGAAAWKVCRVFDKSIQDIHDSLPKKKNGSAKKIPKTNNGKPIEYPEINF